ncbi:PilZ domain-containing protein [Devosia sp.]|uniref:PilZ domain-containing protein n=1 Tax=Devosia sp. TaxID=1871048 RepID=UPI003BAB1731
MQAFACRITSISASGLVLVAPVQGQIGEAVLVDVEGYGIVRCEVQQLREDGFVCRTLLTDDQIRRLDTWVGWLRRRGGRISGDKRGHMRLKPRDARTTLTLSDGTAVRGLVTDLSRSGAAVSTDCMLEMGSLVVVGHVPARVVRALAVGFAVEFERVLEAKEADTLVTGFEPMAVTIAAAI